MGDHRDGHVAAVTGGEGGGASVVGAAVAERPLLPGFAGGQVVDAEGGVQVGGDQDGPAVRLAAGEQFDAADVAGAEGMPQLSRRKAPDTDPFRAVTGDEHVVLVDPAERQAADALEVVGDRQAPIWLAGGDVGEAYDAVQVTQAVVLLGDGQGPGTGGDGDDGVAGPVRGELRAGQAPQP